MTLSNNEIIGIVVAALVFSGVGIVLLNDALQAKAQKEFEGEFSSQHRELIYKYRYETPGPNDFIKLPISNKEVGFLMRLCKQSTNRWTLRYYTTAHIWSGRSSYQPSVQTCNIGFRRITSSPKAVRAEVIRCSHKYALIKGGDGVSGYVLEHNPYDDAFYIYTKFFNMG